MEKSPFIDQPADEQNPTSVPTSQAVYQRSPKQPLLNQQLQSTTTTTSQRSGLGDQTHQKQLKSSSSSSSSSGKKIVSVGSVGAGGGPIRSGSSARKLAAQKILKSASSQSTNPATNNILGSPTDKIMSPCTKQLQARKQRPLGGHGKSLHAKLLAETFNKELQLMKQSLSEQVKAEDVEPVNDEKKAGDSADLKAVVGKQVAQPISIATTVKENDGGKEANSPEKAAVVQ